MILDRLDAFQTTANTGIETLGGTSSGVSLSRGLGATGAMDTSGKKYLNIYGIAVTSSETITIKLMGGTDDSTFGTTEYTTGAITGTTDLGATRLKIQLPENMKKFVRIEWTKSATSDSLTFRAFLSNS
jgi:hypothetical protein